MRIVAIETHKTPGGLIGCFIKMKRAEGRSVAQLINNDGLSAEAGRSVVANAATALAAAIEQKVMPFDVHAENVMRAEDGTLTFLDFGLYEAVDQGVSYELGDYLSHYVQFFRTVLTDSADKASVVELRDQIAEKLSEKEIDEEGRGLLCAGLRQISNAFATEAP